jgi:DNA (cytosine-5)-methyltransferase 1
VWSGSCPCQPFSAAGRGAGFADERHLWPAWHWLVGQHRPAVVFGEQVAAKAAEPWLDLVQADLEGLGYAVGAVPVPAAGIGAPHIRDRLWWVADATHGGWREQRDALGARQGRHADGCGNASGRLAHSSSTGLEGRDAREVGRQRPAAERGGGAGGVADAERNRQHNEQGKPREQGGQGQRRHQPVDGCDPSAGPGPLHGFWRDADWLLCRDGKWRPVEPGTFPLAHGVSNRVGRLRAYGNAIVPQVAAEFIGAWLDAESTRLALTLL